MSAIPQSGSTPDSVQVKATPSPRRFVPEKIETITRSTRDEKSISEAPKPKRRFIPQPVETTTISSRDRVIQSNSTQRPKSRFAPQLVESTTRTNRSPLAPTSAPTSAPAQGPSTPQSAPVRRFAPQLLGTEKKTSRPLDIPIRPRSMVIDPMPAPFAPENTPTKILSPELISREARRLGIPLPPRRHSLDTPTRQHSFRVPELDPIESSESESERPSRSASTSPSSASEGPERHFKRYPKRSRSFDVLEIAAKRAEQELREQALSAFPNDDRHVQVNHFIDSASVAPSVLPSRRATEYRRTDSELEFQQMRAHHNKIEAEREQARAEKERRRRRLAKDMSDDPAPTPWNNPFVPKGAHLHAVHPLPTPPTAEEIAAEKEMERMRKRARPPMLGEDIEFPRCASPTRARFDVTQGSYKVRNAMCYLTGHAGSSGTGEEGLWRPNTSTAPQVSISPSTDSVSTTTTTATTRSTGGLWGGCCKQTSTAPIRVGPTGLMTPRVDGESSSSEHKMNPLQHLPPSPPSSNPGSGIQTLSEKLEKEQTIESEFDDAFITQVYNYLSLGYGAVARRFDEELAKIARVSVEELRADDGLNMPKGYIRLGDDEPSSGDAGITGESCARWKALKVYIHEWARQQPNMNEGVSVLGGFAVTARKGSWAI